MSESSNPEPVLTRFNCFLVQKVSHSGNLVLHPSKIVFESSTEQVKITISIDQIKHIETQKVMVATNTLTISTDDQQYNFSGVHEASNFKAYVELLQKIMDERTDTHGFVKDSKEEKIAWKPFQAPVIILDYCFNAPLSSVRPVIEDPLFFVEVNTAEKNFDITHTEWVNHGHYKERTYTYKKPLSIGTAYIEECQRLFQIQDGIGLHILTLVDNIPFANCFETHVQISFTENGNRTQCKVNLFILWKASFFMKSKFESSSITQCRAQYVTFSKILNTKIGASEDENKEERVSFAEKFDTIKKYYKITIFVLLLILVICFLRRNWSSGKYLLSLENMFEILSLVLFLLMLIAF